MWDTVFIMSAFDFNTFVVIVVGIIIALVLLIKGILNIILKRDYFISIGFFIIATIILLSEIGIVSEAVNQYKLKLEIKNGIADKVYVGEIEIKEAENDDIHKFIIIEDDSYILVSYSDHFNWDSLPPGIWKARVFFDDLHDGIDKPLYRIVRIDFLSD